VEETRVPVAGGSVGAFLSGAGSVAVALAHGAGGTRRTPLLGRVATALAATGRRVLLFDFPYVDAGRRAPDPPSVLEATVASVAGHLRGALGARHVVLGGKSMGGRIASQAVAGGLAADALTFLGYPLHPPARPEVLRDRHLAAIRAPMLFLQGTRDSFARWDLIEGVCRRLGSAARLVRLEGADHSFRVPKRSGRTDAEVEAELMAALLGFLDDHGL